MKKVKYKYTKKCDSCGSVSWNLDHINSDFDGNNEIYVFECRQCNRFQSEKEVNLEVVKK